MSSYGSEPPIPPNDNRIMEKSVVTLYRLLLGGFSAGIPGSNRPGRASVQRVMKKLLPTLVAVSVPAFLLVSCAADPYYYSATGASYYSPNGYVSSAYDRGYYADYTSDWADWGIPLAAGVIAGAVFAGWDDDRDCYVYRHTRCHHCGHYPCRGGHHASYRHHYKYHRKPLHPVHQRARYAHLRHRNTHLARQNALLRHRNLIVRRHSVPDRSGPDFSPRGPRSRFFSPRPHASPDSSRRVSGLPHASDRSGRRSVARFAPGARHGGSRADHGRRPDAGDTPSGRGRPPGAMPARPAPEPRAKPPAQRSSPQRRAPSPPRVSPRHQRFVFNRSRPIPNAATRRAPPTSASGKTSPRPRPVVVRQRPSPRTSPAASRASRSPSSPAFQRRQIFQRSSQPAPQSRPATRSAPNRQQASRPSSTRKKPASARSDRRSSRSASADRSGDKRRSLFRRPDRGRR